MKKFIILLSAFAVLGAISCKKDDADAVPTYAEGRYQPIEKIASIAEDGSLTQQWTWGKKNLEQIAMAGGGLTTLSYSGNLISKVTTDGASKEEIRYTYANKQFAGSEIYYNDAKSIAFNNILHDANGKINGADITISDGFLMSMLGGMFGNGGGLIKNFGRPFTESLAKMAQLRHQVEGSKFEFAGTTMNMSMIWDGENVKKLIVHGDITVNISTEDIDLVSQFMPIPEEYLGLIQMAMMLGGGKLPLNIAYNDTTVCTYDNNYNPMFCNWTQMFSPQNLSLNNLTYAEHLGSMDLSAKVMGQSVSLMSTPLNSNETYVYEYNDKKYPTLVIGEKDITYTYKQ